MTAPYEIEGRELVAEAEGLRVQVLTLARGEEVPWHRHTVITDTFFCLEGPMVVETREPSARHELVAGGRLDVLPGRPHRVSGGTASGDGGRCRFALVQGVGEYDYLPEP